MASHEARHLESVFAAKIRLAQAQAGLTNPQLARTLEVSERLLGKWRAGENRPSMGNLIRLSRILGKPVSWFFEEAA